MTRPIVLLVRIRGLLFEGRDTGQFGSDHSGRSIPDAWQPLDLVRHSLQLVEGPDLLAPQHHPGG
jgi:hypothetical protein